MFSTTGNESRPDVRSHDFYRCRPLVPLLTARLARTRHWVAQMNTLRRAPGIERLLFGIWQYPRSLPE
jgi:hypothetical protein